MVALVSSDVMAEIDLDVLVIDSDWGSDRLRSDGGDGLRRGDSGELGPGCRGRLSVDSDMVSTVMGLKTMDG